MKKIVIICGYAPSLLTFRGELIRTLTSLGHAVTALAPDFTPAVREGLARLGATARPVRLDRGGMDPASDLLTLLSLRRALKRERPDIVLGYTIKPVIYGSIAAASLGAPRICSMITGLGQAFSGEGLTRRLLSRLAESLYRIGLRFNDKVFFQNPDDRDLFLRLGVLRGPDQAVLINGSGVDLERFRPAPLPGRPSFLLMARLIKEKGVVEYAEAARALKRRYPQARFRLAGWLDGGAASVGRAALEAWTREGVVEHLGHLQDVRPAIAEASVLALPTYYREGSPRSILEAMAMGRAVITTDAPGCRETTQDGDNGFLVAPRSVDALAQAMERFIVEPSLAERMGRRSRQLAEEKYDVRQVNAVILDALGLGRAA